MTSTMTDDTEQGNAALLAPGTLIYLWPPGETAWQAGAKPTAARVRQAKRDVILGTDLQNGEEGRWDVAVDLTNPARLRWTWEVFAPPQPSIVAGVEVIAAIPSPADRARFVCGEVGTKARWSLRNGETVHGTLTKLVMGQDHWEAEWCEVVDYPEGRDVAVHVIRVADITKVTRFRSA